MQAVTERERERAEERGALAGTVNERHIAPTNERTDGRRVPLRRRPDPFASAVAPKRTRCACAARAGAQVPRRGLLFKPLFCCISYTYWWEYFLYLWLKSSYVLGCSKGFGQRLPWNIGLLLGKLCVVVCFHSRHLTICKHSCVRHISWGFRSVIRGKQTMFTNHKASAMEADNNSQLTQ